MVKGQFFTLAALILVIALISSAAVTSTISQQNNYTVQHEENLHYIFQNIRSETIRFLELYLTYQTRLWAQQTPQGNPPSVNDWIDSVVKTYSERGIHVFIELPDDSSIQNYLDKDWNTSGDGYSTIGGDPNDQNDRFRPILQVKITVSDGSTTISETFFCSITYELKDVNIINQITGVISATFVRLIKIYDSAGNPVINIVEGVDFAERILADDDLVSYKYHGAGEYTINIGRSISGTITITAISRSGVIVKAPAS